MTPDKPDQALPKLPDAPAPAPVFGQSPIGKKPKQKSMTASFLGADALPSASNAGVKSLTGQ